MFYPRHGTALMWGCQSRKACGTGLQKQLHVYIRSTRSERIWKLWNEMRKSTSIKWYRTTEKSLQKNAGALSALAFHIDSR